MWRSIRQLPALRVSTICAESPSCATLSFSSLPKPHSFSTFIVQKPLGVAPTTKLWGSEIRSSRKDWDRVISRFYSSASTAQQQDHTALDWNEAVPGPDFGGGNGGGTVEENKLRSIPVRAYFFSTSVDLRRLVEQKKQNFIPPTSRMTNCDEEEEDEEEEDESESAPTWTRVGPTRDVSVVCNR